VKARSYAADQLFATLDTTTRSLYLEQAGMSVSLSDTVGFIRDLPHKLVEAFRATLQEAADADLLLHVVDAASPNLDEQMREVERVLAEIDAAGIPQILVYNKQDMLDDDQRPREAMDWLERPDVGQGGAVRVPRVFVSALDGTGLDILREQIVLAMQRAPSDASSDPRDPRDLNFRTSPQAGGMDFDSEQNPLADSDPDAADPFPTQA